MKNLLKVAEEFGRIIWPLREILEIKDIMIYGSITYRRADQNDLDLLIFHDSEILEKFQDIADSNISDLEKLMILTELLKGKLNLTELLKGSQVEKLVSEGKFNSKYIDVKFFTDGQYRKKWIEMDQKIHSHEKPKNRLGGESFLETIFRQGLLWNSITQKYDIKAKDKYKLPKQP